MNSEQVIYEPGAKVGPEERLLLDWVQANFQGTIVVLAESQQDGVKTPDILVDNRRIELKTTSGNLTTLDTLLRRAARQSKGECVIVNIQNVSYTLDEAKNVAERRMQRSGIGEVYLLYQNAVVHLLNQEGGN